MLDALRAELKRPGTIIAVALAALGISVGLAVAVYFYEKGRRVGQVAYQVDQVQVFDRERVAPIPLTLFDSEGHKITNNVYAANLAVWNTGNAEIKKEDVR